MTVSGARPAMPAPSLGSAHAEGLTSRADMLRLPLRTVGAQGSVRRNNAQPDSEVSFFLEGAADISPLQSDSIYLTIADGGLASPTDVSTWILGNLVSKERVVCPRNDTTGRHRLSRWLSPTAITGQDVSHRAGV